jgi:hypothetical protein
MKIRFGCRRRLRRKRFVGIVDPAAPCDQWRYGSWASLRGNIEFSYTAVLFDTDRSLREACARHVSVLVAAR